MPKGLNIYQVPELAPTDEILSLRHNPTKYARKYEREILGIVSLLNLFRRLESIMQQENKDKVVLLCFESPDKFCHRHLVAKWLEVETGKTIEEVLV